MKKFLQNLFASKKSTSPAKRTAFRPQVEALEVRLVPATLGIDNGVLTYTAATGEQNFLRIDRNQAGNYTFTDNVNIRIDGTNVVGRSHTISPDAINSIVLNMGDQADIVTVKSVGHTMTVNGSTGDDGIFIGNDSRGMDNITGRVTVNGDGGYDQLLLVDRFAQNAQTYSIFNNTVYRTGAGTITYSSLNDLSIAGTDKADQFYVNSTAAAMRVFTNGNGGDDVIYMGSSGRLSSLGSSIILNGGSGNNWLDYSYLTTATAPNSQVGVNVDLTAATASGVVTGFQNIQNARGTQYDDTLFGSTSNNILVGLEGTDSLFGRDGRDILIGGRGVDTLVGGAGDDILIGGVTTLSMDNVALQATMSEWRSTNSYTTRTARISGQQTGGANGNFLFNYISPTAGTVVDDNALDTLLGGNLNGNAPADNTGQDWFFCLSENITTELRDRASNERVN